MPQQIVTPTAQESINILNPNLEVFNKARDFNKLIETYQLTEDIIKQLTPASTLELFNSTGSEKDLDNAFDAILDETYRVLYGEDTKERKAIQSSALGYLDALSNDVDEILRCENLNYFITSILPDFEMNLHHIQWGEIVMRHPYFLVLAARDHGKSYMFSMAYPAWQLYRFKPKNRTAAEQKNKRGFLFSFSITQAIDLLAILKENIESNDILKDRLYDKNSWSKVDITCKNRSRLTVKGFGSAVRGAHPGWIMVDDGLKDNVIYSQVQREKNIDYFHSVIMNMLVPSGQIGVVGCVNEKTLIPIKDKGLVRIGNLYKGDKNKKQLINFSEYILGKNGIDLSTHFWNNGLTKTKKITLQYGYNLECSLKHPLLKMSDLGIPEWVRSPKLKVGDYIAVKKGNGLYGQKICLKDFKNRVRKNQHFYKKMILPDYVTEDLAYLIGLWVAEGNFEKDGTVAISATESDIANFLLSHPFGLKFKYFESNNSYKCSSVEFLELLEYLKCPLEKAILKNIPETFFQADFNTQKAFLQGLCDGDGCCYLNEKDKFLQVTLGSVNKEMLNNIQVMLLNMGILSRKNTIKKAGTTTYIHGELVKNNFDLHHLECGGYNGLEFLRKIGFRLKRKNKIVEAERLYEGVSFINKIPLQYELLKKIRSTCLYSQKSKYNCSLAGKKHVSTDVLKTILNIMVNERGASGEFVELFRNNINDDFIWLPIESIEDSESYTMDFVIPKHHSFISNGLISHNTPFHGQDLYGDLKTKEDWHVYEFPAIYANGDLLWQSRWNYDALMKKRRSQGNLIFSRELLCRPITSDSTIFPIEILNNAFIHMDDVVLVENRENYVKKFEKVVVGCDFAMSSSVGADYSVFGVWGIDDKDCMWLMHFWRKKGASFAEQIAKLKSINLNFRPNIMMLEKNQFQQIFVEESERQNLPVKGHTTTAVKNDLKKGLPSLAIMFERGKFKIPQGNQQSKDVGDIFIQEFSSVAFTDNGLMATEGHDDCAMQTYIAVEAARDITVNEFKFGFI